jgi:predicted metal-dependent enzyme (double-stranded beta helix superfamily)
VSATSLSFHDFNSYQISRVDDRAHEPDVATAAALVRQIAADPGTWRQSVEFGAGDDRWYSRLDLDPHHEIWLISWLPGQSTGLHDHGEALGAFLVVEGTLNETAVRPPSQVGGSVRTTRRDVPEGHVRGFGYEHIHDVANLGPVPAISLHAYAPELTAMTQYVLEDQRLRVVSSERAGVNW